MQLIDTHCHIHSKDFSFNLSEVDNLASEAGVEKMICVGTDQEDSELAVNFVQNRLNSWASIGLHPHDAKLGDEAVPKLRSLVKQPKVVAVGECGLDYFYSHSPKEQQITILRAQIELALENDLPLIFHVREAFEDFWPIFKDYKGVRGVLHSFTDSQVNLDKALVEGLYIGVNGIATFTKNDTQKEMFKSIPVTKLLLETDSPFLTPAPLRGNMNTPANIRVIAEHLSIMRQQSLDEIAASTTNNAKQLFKI